MNKKFTSIFDFQKPSTFSIAITQQCNLECKYCQQSSSPHLKKTLKFKEIKPIIDYLSKNLSEPKILHITGGEPFIHPDVFKIISYSLEKGFTLIIQTNGTLLPRMSWSKLSVLADENVNLKVSLDGWDEESNSKFRSKDSFKLIDEALTILNDIKNFVAVKAVLYPFNLQRITQLFDYLIEKGVTSFTYNVLYPYGRATTIKKSEFLNEFDVVKKIVKVLNMERYYRRIFCSNILQYLILQDIPSIDFKTVYMGPDGGIYKAQIYSDENKLGSIFSENWMEIIDPENFPTTSLHLNEEVRRFVSSHYRLGGEINEAKD